jgi:hypothetical protein
MINIIEYKYCYISKMSGLLSLTVDPNTGNIVAKGDKPYDFEIISIVSINILRKQFNEIDGKKAVVAHSIPSYSIIDIFIDDILEYSITGEESDDEIYAIDDEDELKKWTSKCYHNQNATYRLDLTKTDGQKEDDIASLELMIRFEVNYLMTSEGRLEINNGNLGGVVSFTTDKPYDFKVTGVESITILSRPDVTVPFIIPKLCYLSIKVGKRTLCDIYRISGEHDVIVPINRHDYRDGYLPLNKDLPISVMINNHKGPVHTIDNIRIILKIQYGGALLFQYDKGIDAFSIVGDLFASILGKFILPKSFYIANVINILYMYCSFNIPDGVYSIISKKTGNTICETSYDNIHRYREYTKAPNMISIDDEGNEFHIIARLGDKAISLKENWQIKVFCRILE